MAKPLSELERRVLDYLVEYLRENTYQPSIREIGRRFAIKSTKTVSELLQSLADKGWIERDPSRSRGVRLLGLEMDPRTVTVPWYDQTHDDSTAASDRVVDAFELDRKLAGSSGTFIVAMSGNHLVSEGIHDGDLLLIEPVRADALESDDVVLARAGGMQRVQKLERRDGVVLLDSGGAQSERIPVPSGDNVEILGRVVSVVRRLRVPVPATQAPQPPPAHESV